MDEYKGRSILSIDLEFARMFKKKYNKVAIMEVGMVLIEDYGLPYQKETRYSKMFNPQVKVSNYVKRVTGISRSMLRGLPRIEEYHEEIQEMLDKADILLFHGGRQDVRALNICNFNIKGKIIEDTLIIAREIEYEFENHSLVNLTNEFQIMNKNAHRALNDAIMTFKVYEKLILLKNEV